MSDMVKFFVSITSSYEYWILTNLKAFFLLFLLEIHHYYTALFQY